jgi:hypothetical protein
MNIQYVGFDVGTGCRTYKFKVLNTIVDAREFAITINVDAFASTSLKLQEGPDICFGRLQRELAAETEESRAERNLSIEEHDIQEYLERHRSANRITNKLTPHR